MLTILSKPADKGTPVKNLDEETRQIFLIVEYFDHQDTTERCATEQALQHL